jgi:hypothetical protein
MLRPGGRFAHEQGAGAGGDYPCELIEGWKNRTVSEAADVVFFNAMDYIPEWPKPPGQLWVGSYWESPDHYNITNHPAVMDAFDYVLSYSFMDDFPLPNMMTDTVRKWRPRTRHLPLPTWEDKRKEPWVSVWISNCGGDTTDRLDYLHRLQAAGVSTASYGMCERTHEDSFPISDQAWDDFVTAGGDTKIGHSAQHLFMYAAENSNCGFYHTEKVFHALMAGTVPVYRGAGTIPIYLPRNSVINANDFATPEALAQHLTHLATHREAYEELLAWRREPSPPAMKTLMDFGGYTTPKKAGAWRSALCQFLHQAPKRSPPRTVSQCPPGRRKLKRYLAANETASVYGKRVHGRALLV